MADHFFFTFFFIACQHKATTTNAVKPEKEGRIGLLVVRYTILLLCNHNPPTWGVGGIIKQNEIVNP